jgi:membrane protease YdiL (CAAX protease family)
VGVSSASSGPGRLRRWVEVIAFVGVWIAAGKLLHMSSTVYLLFGIPLTAGFQLLVRKKPIKDLWVRGGPGITLRAVSLRVAIVAAVLAIDPLYRLISGIAKEDGLGFALYYLAAIVGAGAAAYALKQFTRVTWRNLLLCLAIAGTIGALLSGGLLDVFLSDAGVLPKSEHLQPNVLDGIESLFLYIPVVFVMEEVAFRGAIDSHVYHPGEEGHGSWSVLYGVLSAIVVSLLWGIWHYPIVPDASILQLLIPMGAVGPFLSLFWRRSGNLMVPGFTHAVIDSIRNALGLAP